MKIQLPDDLRIARIQKERDLEIKLLREQIEYFKKQKFGPKPEKTSVITGQLVMPELLRKFSMSASFSQTKIEISS